MRLLDRLLRKAPALDATQRERLRALRERAAEARPTHQPHAQSRFVTVDVETSGLNMHRDRVLAIGAVFVENGRIDLARCFETVLRQDKSSSHENILVHHIGGQRQLGGVEPAEAMLAFLEYVDGAPLVAFRALFDRTFLNRTARACLGVQTHDHWFDLAKLLPVIFPDQDCRVMDDWLRLLGVRMLARHHALADALATAQMLLKCLPLATALGIETLHDLLELEKAQTWLGNS
jgi:DNA polymerase-3 subunit epsilon